MGIGRTYGAGVAGKIIDFLQLWEDDDGLPFGFQAFPECGVSDDGRGESAAETAGDKEVGGGLDGVLGGLIQGCSLLAATECERSIVDCINV